MKMGQPASFSSTGVAMMMMSMVRVRKQSKQLFYSFLVLVGFSFFRLVFLGEAAITKLFVIHIFVEKFIDLIHFEIGDNLSKLVDLDFKPL